MSKLTKFFKSPRMFIADAIYNRRKPAAKPAAKLQTFIDSVLCANIGAVGEVAVYFDGKAGNIYQIEQWLSPFSVLDKLRRIVFIVREKEAFDWLKQKTTFPVVYCRLIEDVIGLYERSEFKCVLYVNNAQRNFQSLIIGNVLHVHINHGESDKLSTITNQSKAYDYVLIVGDAAYDKYNLNLIRKDMSRFIKIGRPQIEHVAKVVAPDINKSDPKLLVVAEQSPAPDVNALATKSQQVVREVLNQENVSNAHELEASEKDFVGQTAGLQEQIALINRRVVLYAPTWEGTHESMNYTSLNDFGLSIVKQVLEHPDLYLIYKPHPNTGSRNKATGSINKEICQMLAKHHKGHYVAGGDINSLYEYVDLAIFDNSAVAIDYLIIDKPMLMTDMFFKIVGRHDTPVITKAARMIGAKEIERLVNIVWEEIKSDTKKIERTRIKHYFLGDFDYANKGSTQKFIETIDEICCERDVAVQQLSLLLNSSLNSGSAQ